MEKVKVSVIGLRHAAQVFHLPGLSKFSDVELSICDLNQDLMRTAGQKFGIPENRQYTDYRQMLKKEEPQAVYVLMAQYAQHHNFNYNPETYFDIVKEVLSQKRAVLVEKPLAMTLDRAYELAIAAKAAGVVNMVSVNRRFNPLLQHCREKVLQCGPILNVVCNFYKGFKPDAAPQGCLDWLAGDMIHSLDLMRYLIGGKIEEFYPSQAKTAQDEAPTAFYAMACSDNGATGLFSSNIRVGGRVQNWQIHGDGISCYLCENFAPYDYDETGMHMNAVIVRRDSKEVERICDADLVANEFSQYAGFTSANRYFIDCVKNGQEAHCSFTDNVVTLDLCKRIIDSRLKSI